MKDNRTEVEVPKYNNKVQNSEMFDKETKVVIPMKALNEPSMKGNLQVYSPSDLSISMLLNG